MTWFNIIKNDPTKALLEIIMSDLQVTIPHSIESMTFMHTKLKMPIDTKSIRESFARTWRDSEKAIKMDSGWMDKFIGDGYTLDEVNWYTVGEKVMGIVDGILNNM